MGWEPIETAPKDGTPILALWPYWATQSAFETVWVADESEGDAPGWWAKNWGHILDGEEPVAWMPLPDAP